MSLSQEQTRFVIEGLEKDLGVAASLNPERRKYRMLWVMSITETFLVMTLRSAIASGLAYMAWISWPSRDVFNVGVFAPPIDDFGWAIVAVLCALAVPYALLAPWK